MLTDPPRVTVQHITGLAAAGKMRGNRTVLALTTDGLGYVSPDHVIADNSNVRRMLLTLTDLREEASNAGLTVSGYLKANAARIVAELNAVLTGDDGFDLKEKE